MAFPGSFGKRPIDRPGSGRLGRHGREIRETGFRNVNHVGERWDSGFLNPLGSAVNDTAPP